MSKLQFDYRMQLTYSEPVTECHYKVKCFPQDTDMQQITELNIEIQPHTNYQRSIDSFGNLMIYDNLYFPHTEFVVHVSGTAETWLSVSQKESGFVGQFCYPHRLNQSGTELKTYFNTLQPLPDTSPYDTAMYLMHALHRDFRYEQSVTEMETTAEQAWQLGKGVCQDYAHIFIALCHMCGIPARYVTGMMIGEGHSHAWVEILDHNHWYALDPTNDCIAADTYIKIAHGRDAKDCMMNKGIIKGGGIQKQTVTVRVTKENL